MKNRKTLVRSWTNPAFRATLSDAERAALPASPAGDAALENVVGGNAAAKSFIELSGVVTEKGNYGTASVGLCAPEGADCGVKPVKDPVG